MLQFLRPTAGLCRLQPWPKPSFWIVMPSFGDNKNVMCFVNDLYVYLKARASDNLPPGQLGGRNHVDRPEASKAEEKACLG